MTKLYLISYDLSDASGGEYKALMDYIEGVGKNGWLHPLKSTFMVVSDLSVFQIDEGIKNVLKNQEGQLRRNTRWLITPIRLDDSIGWLDQDSADWWEEASQAGF